MSASIPVLLWQIKCPYEPRGPSVQTRLSEVTYQYTRGVHITYMYSKGLWARHVLGHLPQTLPPVTCLKTAALYDCNNKLTTINLHSKHNTFPPYISTSICLTQKYRQSNAQYTRWPHFLGGGEFKNF